jgi:uncharacterized glyoxalase superfamily protein PhnB
MTTATRTQPGAWPTLSYRDAEAALRFLTEVVGFTESVVHPGGPDRPIAHAELLWPDGGGVMFGSEPKEAPWSGSAGGPGTGTIYLSVGSPADLDALAGRVAGAGWTLLRELTETVYGSREFAFLDPVGNAWSAGTYRGAQAG